MEEGDEIFALYYPKGVNGESLIVEAEEIAYFQLKEHKVLRIHGQVRLIKGNLTVVGM